MIVAVKIKTPASPPSSRITSIGTKMTIIPSTNAIFTRSFPDRPACLTRYQAVSPVSGKNNASVTGQGRRLCVSPPIGVRPAEMMKNDTMKPSPKRKKSNSLRSGRSPFGRKNNRNSESKHVGVTKPRGQYEHRESVQNHGDCQSDVTQQPASLGLREEQLDEEERDSDAESRVEHCQGG